MPRVITASHAGVCFGVKRAIALLDEAVAIGKRENRPVLMLGPIIHNPRFIAQCRERGIIVTDLTGITDHSVVVVRSHGITRTEEEHLARFTDIRIVDATCPFVQRIHKLVAERSRAGWAIVVLGDASHAEVEGFVSRIEGHYFVHPPDFSDNAVASLTGFVTQHQQIYAVAQTTSQPANFATFLQYLLRLSREYGCIIEHQNTVCDATFQRQNAARELARSADVMVVIGGRNSSNTAKLFAIVREQNPRSFWIETPQELSETDRAALRTANTVGITAGASTPDNQIEELVAFMESL